MEEMLGEVVKRADNKDTENSISVGLVMPRANKQNYLKSIFDLLSYDS